MTYTILSSGWISRTLDNGSMQQLPPVDNGTGAWAEYQAWLDAGHTPEQESEPQPGVDYRAFWKALLQAGVYGAIRQQAASSLLMNTIVTEFIALLADAKNGYPEEAALQAAITAILQTGTFGEAELAELQAAMSAGRLDQVYTLA